MKTYILGNVSDIERWQTGLPFDAHLFAQHRASAHIIVCEENDVFARCSVWLSQLSWQSKNVGFLGHYSARDDSAANRALESACTWLGQNGCDIAVGPMDGNTWRSYRFVIEAGIHPPFLLEPQNPDCYPQQFIDAGFTISARYSSIICEDLTYTRGNMDKHYQRLLKNGVTIRALDVENWDAKLRSIYDVCLRSFSRNFLYEPISEGEFLAQYASAKNFVRPELVLLAEHQERTVGFCFSIPDFLQQQRGETMDTIVMKTVAVLPERCYAGLGNVLAEQSHRVAHQLGFRRAIHALMYDGNASRNASTCYGKTMRRYALFARDLSS